MDESRLDRELEDRVEAMGFELVEIEKAGSKAKPVLRLRIDLPDSEPGRGVSVDDCTRVSRALQPFLDTEAGLPARYVLEVSSPGVERPLVRERDWVRFVGREIALHGRAPLAGRSRRLEGTLLGLVEGDGGERVRLQLADDEIVDVPRDEVDRAHLVFRW